MDFLELFVTQDWLIILFMYVIFLGLFCIEYQIHRFVIDHRGGFKRQEYLVKVVGPRMSYGFALCFILACLLDNSWYRNEWGVSDVVYYGTWIYAGLIAATHWSLWDGWHSTAKGKDFFYIPEDVESSRSDAFFLDKKKLYVASKILAIVFSVAVLLFITYGCYV